MKTGDYRGGIRFRSSDIRLRPFAGYQANAVCPTKSTRIKYSRNTDRFTQTYIGQEMWANSNGLIALPLNHLRTRSESFCIATGQTWILDAQMSQQSKKYVPEHYFCMNRLTHGLTDQLTQQFTSLNDMAHYVERFMVRGNAEATYIYSSS